mmetsp:Transcript_77459/g.206856  ORF Transcript_77459/g.206856 Transcript_77459/m.206856 type:complete len:432 (+) Transcript_77459:20-1315(+)
MSAVLTVVSGVAGAIDHSVSAPAKVGQPDAKKAEEEKKQIKEDEEWVMPESMGKAESAVAETSRTPVTDHSPNMFPYMSTEAVKRGGRFVRHRSLFMRFVLGGVLRLGHKWLFSFSLWGLAWTIVMKSLSDDLPDWVTQIVHPDATVVSLITFVFGFFLTYRASMALTRYKIGGSEFNNFLGNVAALCQLVLGVVNVHSEEMKSGSVVNSLRWEYNRKLGRMECHRQVKEVVNGVIEECRMLLKSLPYCMIFTYREGVHLSKLPLSEPLYHELLMATHGTSSAINGLLALLSRRMGALVHAGLVHPPVMGALWKKIDDCNSSVGMVENCRRLGPPRLYSDHLQVCMVLYLALLPLVLYPLYGWGTLIYYPVIMYVTLGLYMISEAIQEPFADANNPYMDLDLMAWAHQTCREVDGRFDMFIREFRSLRQRF